MRQRRVRTPNRATAKDKPIQRPDTYQRLPEDVQLNTCEQEPVHTLGSEPSSDGFAQGYWNRFGDSASIGNLVPGGEH